MIIKTYRKTKDQIEEELELVLDKIIESLPEYSLKEKVITITIK